MAGLLYFIPGLSRTVRPRDWIEAGIGHAFPDGNPTPRGCQCGPDGAAGVVLADPKQNKKIGYFSGIQEWRKSSNGKFHVGRFVDSERPLPEDLATDEQLEGHWVTLGDNQRYLIPVARSLIAEDDATELQYREALPTIAERNGDGHWHMGAVIPKWRPLWEIAEKWWTTKTAAITRKYGDGKDPEDSDRSMVIEGFDDLFDSATEAIGVNYRVRADEISLLGLFTMRHATAVLDAVVDWPVYLEWAKKKLIARSRIAPDGSPIVDGDLDSIEVTDQA